LWGIASVLYVHREYPPLADTPVMHYAFAWGRQQAVAG